MATLEEALIEFYRRQIGVSICSFPGVGWRVRLGDNWNGFLALHDFQPEEFDRIGDWILQQAATIPFP
jgi:hypothetical protein